MLKLFPLYSSIKMSSAENKEKTTKSPNKNIVKKVNFKSNKKKAIRKDLERMRKSKGFRDLGDMLYLD